jgi:ankyrin repeat protein
MEGEGTLWYPAWSRDVRLTRQLLAEGADLNVAVAGGKTPLIEAVDEPGSSRRRPGRRWWRRPGGGAEVHAREDESTALVSPGGPTCGRRDLLAAGTDPTTRDHQGLTPLDVARRTSS